MQALLPRLGQLLAAVLPALLGALGRAAGDLVVELVEAAARVTELLRLLARLASQRLARLLERAVHLLALAPVAGPGRALDLLGRARGVLREPLVRVAQGLAHGRRRHVGGVVVAVQPRERAVEPVDRLAEPIRGRLRLGLALLALPSLRLALLFRLRLLPAPLLAGELERLHLRALRLVLELRRLERVGLRAARGLAPALHRLARLVPLIHQPA